MGRDEVHRRIMGLAVVHERRDPLAVAGGGTADLQFIIHCFDSLGGDFIQTEIVLLRAVKERSFQVRLVPDLKEPCFHFLFADVYKRQQYGIW